jgi:hypothetical protein
MKIEDLTPEALSYLTERGGLWNFLTKVWGLDLDEQPHREMVTAIEDAEYNDDVPYVMQIVPRGTYKSSILRGVAAWKQLRQIYVFGNVYHRIVIASATLALGRSHISAIGAQFQTNKMLILLYGDLWRDGGYRGQRHSNVLQGDGIMLAPRIDAGEKASIPEPNFFIVSARRKNTGWHADEGMLDDLHDDESMQTDHQREKAKTYFKLIWPIIQPQDNNGRPARVLLNATRWHDDDVPGYVMREIIEKRSQEDPTYRAKWHIIQRPACTDPHLEEGELYFPRVLTREVLRERLDTLGPYLFSCNYLNDPVAQGGFVLEDQIKFIPRATFPALRLLRAASDPNHHTKDMVLGCWAGAMVGGYDKFANLYIVDAVGSREWDTAEYLDAMFDLSSQYTGLPLLIEGEARAALQHSIQLEEEKRSFESEGDQRIRLNVRWVDVPRDESKPDRWRAMQPRFKKCQIYFADEIETKIKREIKTELVRGMASRFKDFLDMLAMLESGVKPKFDKKGQQQEVVKSETRGTEFKPSLATFFPKSFKGVQ